MRQLMIRLICFALISIVVNFVLAPSAWAFPVTWTFSGAGLSDGGVVTGTFSYDANANHFSNWSVSVSGGDTAQFPAFIYSPSNSIGAYVVWTGFDRGIQMNVNAPSNRRMKVAVVSPFTNAGGTLMMDIASTIQGECYNCNPNRSFISGSLVGTAAPTITSVGSSTFVAGVAGNFTITSTGAPSATIANTGILPNGVTFTDNGNGTATLAGTPTVESFGDYSLTLTASNAVGSNATQAFILHVSDVLFADGFESGN